MNEMKELSNSAMRNLINANQVAIQTMGIQIEQLREHNSSLKELIVRINDRHIRDSKDQWEYYSEIKKEFGDYQNGRRKED